MLCSLTDISIEPLQNLQKVDATLEKIRQATSTDLDGTSQQSYEKNGLLHRRWMPPHCCSDDMAIEKLILPVQCCQCVLQLAQTIPLAGHLGRDKTAQ